MRSAALQNATTIRTARERAEQRQEAYWAEAQRLSHTGSFGWNISTREIVWSEETFRIFQYDRATQPTVEAVLQRVHPQDAALVTQAVERAAREKQDFELEYRLVMPDGLIKHVHVVAHASGDASGQIEYVGAVMDVTEHRRATSALAGEKRLLEMIARGDSRAAILDALCRLVEELASGSLSSILLLDPTANCLRHGAAPSLPGAYTEAIDGIAIGPAVGSCGTAAYLGEPVMVRDIATDPLWADYRALALAHGLRACWSTPILSSDGKVLGTFATYYREPRSPTTQDHNLIEQVTHLASIAIEREQAEEALREREARIRRLVESNIIGVFFWDLAGGVTDANDAFLRTVGYSRQDLLSGRVNWSSMTPPEYRAADEKAIEELMQSGTHQSYEKEYIRGDGSRVTILLGGTFIEGSKGQGVSFVLDLTQRKKAEAELREQASLLDLTHDTVFVRDMKDIITYWNHGAEKLYGWDREEAVGKTTHQLLQTTFPEPLGDIKAQLLRTGRWEGELLHTKRNGAQVVVSTRWALRRDERGNAVAILETNNDITERKRREAELLHNTALLDELFEGSPDAVVLMELEARVLRISREFAALFGYSAEEAAGRPVVDLIVPEDELEDSRAGFARVRSGERFVVERERRRKDGTRIHVSIKRAPIVLGGKPIGY